MNCEYLNKSQILEVLKKISFLDYYFVLNEIGNQINGCYYSYDNDDRQNQTKKIMIFGKFKIPENITSEQLVFLCFEEVLNTLRHEAGELFKVGSLAPFNEHKNYDIHKKTKMIHDLFNWQ